MQNFNTNQTRHFYVAGRVNGYVASNLGVDGTGTANELDINLGVTGDSFGKKMFFSYKNADGIIVRSDTIDTDKIRSVKVASTNPAAEGVASMARPLFATELTIDTAKFTMGTNTNGKVFKAVVTIMGVHDYDMSNSISFVASVTGDSTIDTAAKFYKKLAKAIVVAQPERSEPFLRVIMHKSAGDVDVTGGSGYTDDATSIILVQGPQKYVRGKLSGEPCLFSVALTVDGDDNFGVWGKVNGKTGEEKGEEIVLKKAADVLASGTAATLKYVHPLYQLADLEYFSLGERGDIVRGSAWPNNYEPEFGIPKPAASNAGAEYKMLSIEYFYAGDAENVQKSPRLIEIVGPVVTTGVGSQAVTSDPVGDLYDAVLTAIGGQSASGNGQGA